jgi:hypothetical protein
MIELPAKICLLKLNIFDPDDIEDLKNTHPDFYNKIMDKVFNDTTGMFIKTKQEVNVPKILNPSVVKREKNWTKLIPKKYRTKFKKLGVEAWNEFAQALLDEEIYDPDEEYVTESDVKGMQVIAIPKTEKIPQWLDPYIDYNTLINTILAPFNPVMEIFNVPLIEEGKTRKGVNRKTTTISNIIKF